MANLEINKYRENGDKLRRIQRDSETRIPTVNLGKISVVDNIPSTLGPFKAFKDVEVNYPSSLTTALGLLYYPYNGHFNSYLSSWGREIDHRESETDYQYSRNHNGEFHVPWIQIDAVGFSDEFLHQASYTSPEDIASILPSLVYEYEGSLAMYGMLMGLNPTYERRFRDSLDEVRNRYNKPIALLAVTHEKYSAMRQAELGQFTGNYVDDYYVRFHTGFDAMWGPNEFLDHIKKTKGKSDYLFYVRSSDPVDVLKNPNTSHINHPLLSDPYIRRLLRAYSLTLNVDDPSLPYNSPRRINDTKAYMPEMRMGYQVQELSDLFSFDLLNHLGKSRSFTSFESEEIFNDHFEKFLRDHDIDVSDKEKKVNLDLHAKPMRNTYGCYGHVPGSPSEKKFRSGLSSNLSKRGDYIVQPAILPRTVFNLDDGQYYTYIDRLWMTQEKGRPAAINGYRCYTPANSPEAANRRIHGNSETVWQVINL